MKLTLLTGLAVALLLTACGRSSGTTGGLAEFDRDGFEARLDESELPVIVNVWGSWCPPCRSEAPLFATAHQQFGDRIEFIGVDVQDTQEGAAGFIADYGIEFENLFDRTGEIRQMMGGIGAPITYFIAPGGGLVDTHIGVIDEQQLALGIDELLAQG